jgi:molecular chaperone GrpE
MPAEPGKDFIEKVSPSQSSDAGDPPAEDFTPGAPATEDAEDTVGKLREESKQLRDQLLRKQAEFENFRKRAERDKHESMQYSLLNAVKELLPILDGFERALETNGSGEEYRKGVALIYQQLFGALQKLGLKRVESQGRPFDPRLHEAVATLETNEFPDHQIVEEMQRGYFFKDRLLRPAMVKVAQPKAGGGKHIETR